ncbi:unnamed protein product, partial [Allacma fusca]
WGTDEARVSAQADCRFNQDFICYLVDLRDNPDGFL